MATLVLGAVGSAIGGAFGGAILGFSGAVIGGFIGSTIGSVVDNWIVSSLAPAQRIEGARLDSLRITASTEGAVIPLLFGRMRIGGNIIWATDFREEINTTRQGGGKGSKPKVTTTEYLYYASFAVALCEGEITGIGRVWADGKAMDMTGVTWRWYPGNEVQSPDPFISAKMGAANTPAYRGTAYVVFEELDLSAFGNRLPQISFEVFRPLADPDTAEGLVKAVTLIPASGDPNLANYRYDPKTGRIVLLDFGAVQPIAPKLAADFRALARAALEGGASETRDAMLRIGYFGPATAPHHQALIQSMFEVGLAPLRQDGPFDFGRSDLLERLRDMGLAIGNDRELAHVPPAATLFLHRKIGGMYLMAAKLRARIALRPMVEAYCRETTVPR